MIQSSSSLVLSTFCLALGIVLAKGLLSGGLGIGLSLDVIDPLSFLVAQLAGGVVFLVGVALLTGQTLKVPCGIGVLVRAGFAVGFGAVGTVFALAYTTASEASVVFATQPVLIIAFAWLLLSERPGPAIMVLAVLAFAGVVMITTNGSEGFAESRALGTAFAAFSTTCAALYVVWMRPVTGFLNPLAALILVQSIALGVIGAVWTVWQDPMTPAGPHSTELPEWAAAAGTGVLYYGLAFYLYLMGLKRLEASQAGLFLNLVPVFTVALAYPVLGETLSATQWAGAATVMIAVLLISFAGRQ